MKAKKILSLCMAGVLCMNTTLILGDEFSSGEGDIQEEVIQEDPYVEPQPVYDETQNGEVSDFGSDFVQIVTEAPVIVTEAPIIVTEAPIIVTEAPIIVTEAPIIVTEGTTETTTEEMVTTTEAPPEDKDVLTEEDIQQLNGGEAVLVRQGERLTFLSGTLSNYPVTDVQTASAAIQRISAMLCMAPETSLMENGSQSDAFGNVTWRFVQMQGTTPIEDAQILIFTNAEGKMTGLSSSVATALSPDAGLATQQQAEELVAQRLQAEGFTAQVFPDKTRSTLMTSPSLGGSTGSPAQRLWVVYSENPRMEAMDAPYLAHYLTSTGIYLFDVPSSLPGRPSSLEMYYPGTLFQGMEISALSGDISYQDGNIRSLSLPLLVDSDGMYALGDASRNIAMAMAEEYQSPEQKISLIKAETLEGFTDNDLLVYDAVINAFDFFEGEGIYGPDNAGSGVLLLRDYKDSSGHILPGISYLGFSNGWQVFAYNGSDYYAQAQDLTGSVYAQCVLENLLPNQVYANSQGRIRTALTRILGNLMEQRLQTHPDPDWLLGESLGKELLSMREPASSRQPSFVGDLYYLPDTTAPSRQNLWGGAEVDSSILGLVAYTAFEKGLDSFLAPHLWMKLASSLTPKTTEKELAAMIPWALAQTGLEDFTPIFQESIAAVRLGQSVYQPSKAKEGCALVSLTLPSANVFLTQQPILALYKKGKNDSKKKALSREPRVLSWGEGNTITFMAPAGKYYVHLLIVDSPTGQVLTLTYDGEAWHAPKGQQDLLSQSDPSSEEKKTEKVVRLKEGKTYSLSNAGLEAVDAAFAQLRVQSVIS